MTVSFGTVLQRAKDRIAGQAIMQKLSAVTLIRDVKGRISLFLELLETESRTELTEEEKTNLRQSLAEDLGHYFAQDIWVKGAGNDAYHSLGQMVIDQRSVAPWDDATVQPRWYVLERHISKKAWTMPRRAGMPPWDYDLAAAGHKPAIVSFFSFKGGMGRTTSLAATALTLARKGHRVAIVDLDLEAPGLASLFFAEQDVSFGVVDYLLEKPIQGDAWRVGASVLTIHEQSLLGDEGASIRVLPAGQVDFEFLEKLARLDFQHLMDRENNLVELLQRMLGELAATHQDLDFIFLDARAGFHDVGGLAVADLSHVSVLFGNNSLQTWAGLAQVVRRLAKPDEDDPQPVVLAHAMAPAENQPGREGEIQVFQEKAYDTFSEHYYKIRGEEPRDSGDTEAPFRSIVLPWEDTLRGGLILYRQAEHDEQLEKSRLEGLQRSLTKSPYEHIAKRICELFGRELEKEEGDEDE